jgi:hypothetical protein
MQGTLEQKMAERRTQIAQNQELGVAEYESVEKQSPEVWEVIDGLKHLPGQKEPLVPGRRFHPTERQAKRDDKGRSPLDGKARELTGSEYRDLRSNRVSVAGADIGLRSLAMTPDALEFALDAQMDAADFDGVKPEGAGGKYTKGQVRAVLASRQSA